TAQREETGMKCCLQSGLALRWKERVTRPRPPRLVVGAVTALALAAPAGTAPEAGAALPPGNTVAQWNKLAEDTVVGSGAFQSEGFIYMGYVSEPLPNPGGAGEGGGAH